MTKPVETYHLLNSLQHMHQRASLCLANAFVMSEFAANISQEEYDSGIKELVTALKNIEEQAGIAAVWIQSVNKMYPHQRQPIDVKEPVPKSDEFV